MRVSVTCPVPFSPIASAAAGARSISLPRTNGPRSFIRTATQPLRHTRYQGISLIGAQNVPNFWLQLVSAVLSIIVGVLFLHRPGEAVATLALLLIVFFMVEGFAKLVFSLTPLKGIPDVSHASSGDLKANSAERKRNSNTTARPMTTNGGASYCH
jgi:hypothetical protein